MATELGKAYVQIVPSAKGIKDSIEKEIDPDSTGKSSGTKLGGALKGALVAAGIGIAVKKIFSDAFSFGGELQQNLGGTEAVFGDFASSIKESAQDAYKNMGMSASDYMATANKMGSLFQGSGMDQQKSLDLTSDAMQRAADVASVMGLDTASAMESIAGAAKGNFTMMDNLGVAMNATTLEAYALEKGMNFEWNTASQAEKSELAMKMFMDRTSQYAGNFARESEETWSGSIGAVKASYENLMANLMLGEDLGPSLQALGETVTTFLTKNLVPAVVNILEGLPSALASMLTTLVPAIITAGVDLVTQLGQGIISAAPELMTTADGMMATFLTGLQTQLPLLLNEGVNILTNIVNGILTGLPEMITMAGEMITQFVNGIMIALPSVLEAGAQLLLNVVNGIINNLPQIYAAAYGAVAKFLATIGQNLPQVLQTGIEIIGKLAAGLVQAIPTLIGKIPQIISGIKNAFSGVNWGEVGLNIIKGIAAGLKNAVGFIADAAKEAAKSALDSAKDFLGIKSPSRVFRDQVGKMVSLGLAEGITRNLTPISDAVSEAKNLATGAFTGEMAYSAAVSGFGGVSKAQTTNVGEVVYWLQQIFEKDSSMYMDGKLVGGIVAPTVKKTNEKSDNLNRLIKGMR